MVLAERIDDVGIAGWIAATVAGFWLFWPVGLAIVLFLAWSGRMREWRMQRRGRWYNSAPPGDAGGQRQGGFGPWSGPWGGFGGCGSRARAQYTPSGNAAFDEYRAETLRRLEEEQKEFVEYLERLRQAKDKAEFDQFMADRRRGPVVPDAETA
jgi:hypothetical protein